MVIVFHIEESVIQMIKLRRAPRQYRRSNSTTIAVCYNAALFMAVSTAPTSCDSLADHRIQRFNHCMQQYRCGSGRFQWHTLLDGGCVIYVY